ncbi:excalibur calcium-binding domain-containing protein [Nocardia yamanashiensis]|uniref:excalibur calcium-binding domain-containing protein n=1 Tax=Nocardia yamanashiensis TaxID=209247 RepID=UPI002FCDE569
MNRRNERRLRGTVAAGLGALALGIALPLTMTQAAAEPRIDINPPQTSKAQPYPYYSSCAEVRSKGKAPLYAGQPGYTAYLDPDGNGVACG